MIAHPSSTISQKIQLKKGRHSLSRVSKHFYETIFQKILYFKKKIRICFQNTLIWRLLRRKDLVIVFAMLILKLQAAKLASPVMRLDN